jgi:hypothetical protein
MSAIAIPVPVTRERLTPHDLVTYFRCPHEMELAHVLRATARSSPEGPTLALAVRTPPDVVPLMHSPLPQPPVGDPPVNEGRLDIFPADLLVYEDEGEEEELPILFPSEQVRPDPLFLRHGGNLIDDEMGLSGRPDFILQRSGGIVVPVEYKGTHPFHGLNHNHGRTFDMIQLLTECRLVHAMTGRRPPYGLLLYGDVAGNGEHEGWVQLPYSEAAEHWLQAAVASVRADAVRAPVPSERTCSTCPPHRDGLCRYAVTHYTGGDEPRERFHRLRY